MQVRLGQLVEQLDWDLHLGTINLGAHVMQERRFAMKSPALFTLILVGAAGTAAAEPKQEESSGRVSLSDDGRRSGAAHRPASGWVELADPTTVKHGTTHVMVGKEAGTFGKLRIDAARGKVKVVRVKVHFQDGSSRTYRVGKRLSARGTKSTLVDLKTTKPIDRVLVTTERHTKGEFALYGSSSGGVVAGR